MKKLFRRLLLLAIVAALAAAMTSCSEKDPYAAPAGMITASDEMADFYFYVPDEWTVDYSTAAAGAYFSNTDPSSVSVMAWDMQYTDSTLDDWWELNRSELENVFSNVTVETEENTTVNDLYAKKYVYTAALGEYTYQYMQVACLKGTTVYLFTYASQPDNYDAHLDDVSKMLEYLIIK